MSNLYSNLESGFYLASFDTSMINDALQTTLKNEVGLIQSIRHSKWIDHSKTDAVKKENDSESRVVKMECFSSPAERKRSLKGKRHWNNLAQEDPHFSEIKQASMNLFRQFCIQYGFLRLDMDSSGDSFFVRAHADGNEEKKRSRTSGGYDGAGARNSRGSGGRHRKKLKSDDIGASGGGGGGKRPSDMSSSSEPESAFTSVTASENDETEPTTTSEINVSSSAISKRRSHGRKRRKVQSVQVEAVIEGKNVDEDEDERKIKKRSSSKIVRGNSGRLSGIRRKSKKKSGEIEEEITTGENKTEVRDTIKRLAKRKPRKSRRPSLHLDQHNMETRPIVSSTFSICSLNDVEISTKLIRERDSEWLKWSNNNNNCDHSVDEEDDELDTKEPSVGLGSNENLIQEELEAFINSTMVLDKINSILGLNPYTKVVTSNKCVQVKWVPRSGEYIGVCLNAFVFFTITLSIFSSLLTILEYGTPLSVTQKVIKIDFSHYLTEATFLMLFTLFLTIWAVSCLLELGFHYAEFYSRFNMGICLIKYDATDGIHDMIIRHLGTVLIFEFLLILFFFEGYFYTSIVRESCGFLGYTILRPFELKLRESVYYSLVEIFGLVVFLYCFLCVNLILLNFGVVAKALGNMSKEFNLRMGYTFGTLSVKQEDGTSKYFRKVIPFKKLYAEHKIITSLIRNTSQVNSIVLGAFIFAMVCEIALSMWVFFDIFLKTQSPNLDGLRVYKLGSMEMAVPLRVQNKDGERLTRAGVIFSITWLMYWIFYGILHNAGDACHRGIDFVRRHGLTLCENSKQRRFILSMITSFSPKSPYWIGGKFQFSRAAFLSLTGFVLMASMVTMSFRPERISLSSTGLCKANGHCHMIKVYKMAQSVLYTSIQPEHHYPQTLPGLPIHVEKLNLSSGGKSPQLPSELGMYSKNSFLKSPPCASRGTYPFIESTVAGVVQTEWLAPYSQLRLPFLYKMKSVMDSFASTPKEYILFEGQTIYASAKADGPWKDCYGKNLESPEEDDCHNPSLLTPKRNRLTERVPALPEKQLIAVNQIPSYSKSDRRFFCCYKYGISSDYEVKVCNMRRKEDLDNNCKLSALGSHSVASFIKVLEDKREDAGAKDDLASDVPFSDPVRTLWTNCFCKRDVSECIKASMSK